MHHDFAPISARSRLPQPGGLTLHHDHSRGGLVGGEVAR